MRDVQTGFVILPRVPLELKTDPIDDYFRDNHSIPDCCFPILHRLGAVLLVTVLFV